MSSDATTTLDPATDDVQVQPALLTAATEIARTAAVSALDPLTGSAEQVGEALGVTAEPGSAATHRFAAVLPGYRGWEWAVVLAATPDATDLAQVTVSEVVLLPGPDALVSQQWVPWTERVRAGDLGPGDLLPPAEDDDRLVPGYLASDDPAVEAVALELGLGRKQVMSRAGRLDAAERWFDGDTGPHSDAAKATDLACGTCGFYLPVAGSLQASFGVCGNEMAADGRVVHTEHGCGAHSETEVVVPPVAPVTELTYDDTQLEVLPMPAREPRAKAVADTGGEGSTGDSSPESSSPDEGTGQETGPGAVPGEPLPTPKPEPVSEPAPDPTREEVGPPESPSAPDLDAPVDPDKAVEQDEPARQE